MTARNKTLITHSECLKCGTKVYQKDFDNSIGLNEELMSYKKEYTDNCDLCIGKRDPEVGVIEFRRQILVRLDELEERINNLTNSRLSHPAPRKDGKTRLKGLKHS
jgi:hypothetical protein